MALKILHISSSTTAGAGLCAYRIHHALLEQGVESRMLVADTDKEEPEIFVEPYGYLHRFRVPHIPYLRRWIRKLHSKGWLNTRFEKMERDVSMLNERNHVVFSLPISCYDLSKNHLVEWADIIHLHWAQNFLDYETFFRAVKKPIVWTLHDENIFWGGFHYRRQKEQCYGIYQRYEDQCLEIKRNALHFCHDLHLVALSSMMRELISAQPFLQNYSLDVIHNGVDLSKYQPTAKIEARRILGISEECILIAFCAYNISNPLKGLPDLVKAVERMKTSNVEILCIGGGDYDGQTSVKIHKMGLQSDTEKISMMFSACDLFCLPSYQEAFAQSPVEAMACGLPVVAYPCSGLTDLITEKNGVVAKGFTVEALMDALRHALDTQYDADTFREYVQEHFSMEKIAKQYIALYNKYR